MLLHKIPDVSVKKKHKKASKLKANIFSKWGNNFKTKKYIFIACAASAGIRRSTSNNFFYFFVIYCNEPRKKTASKTVAQKWKIYAKIAKISENSQQAPRHRLWHKHLLLAKRWDVILNLFQRSLSIKLLISRSNVHIKVARCCCCCCSIVAWQSAS